MLDRPDNKQVRVVYANDKAAAAQRGDFPYGSILVMETYRAQEDAGGMSCWMTTAAISETR